MLRAFGKHKAAYDINVTGDVNSRRDEYKLTCVFEIECADGLEFQEIPLIFSKLAWPPVPFVIELH